MQCDVMQGTREIKCFLAFRAAEPSSLAFRDEKMSERLGDEKLDNEARDEKFV